MSTTLIIVTFFTVWWLMLFITLPFGVKRVENPDPLHDPGAPEKSHMRSKLIATTALAILVTSLIYYLASIRAIPLDMN